jgi:hypothetical protein
VLSAGVIGIAALGAVVLWAATGWLWLVVHEGLHCLVGGMVIFSNGVRRTIDPSASRQFSIFSKTPAAWRYSPQIRRAAIFHDDP